MILKWAYESDLIEKAPKFGPDFKGASKRAVRAQKQEAQRKLFSATDIRSILDHCDSTTFGMVLLGINGGLGNTDISSLRQENLDLPAGWITFPRPKSLSKIYSVKWPDWNSMLPNHGGRTSNGKEARASVRVCSVSI